jgi:sulfane dehydrogenase subunit SoxC
MGEAVLAAGDEGISAEELQLAARNHGMPLEALRYDLTPVGLHYLLIHFDIPFVDPSAYRLEVSGNVRRSTSLTLEEVRQAAEPVVTPVTMECAGNGRARLAPRPLSQPWLNEAVGTAEWTGVPLAAVLESAGVEPGSSEVVFTGHDRGIQGDVEQDYQRSLSVQDALRPEVLLAFAMNGQPLLPQHGAPLRLLVPGWYGMAHVKWLRQITVLDREFDGYQNASAYRLRQQPDEAGTPVTRIEPRALVRPPGFPDFMSRVRALRPGPCVLEGRAWSGHAPVTRVEMTTDGGDSWSDAKLDPADGGPDGQWAWRRWQYDWTATPGRYRLSARATDALGRTQPVEQPWNRGGFANNLVQRVEVVVLDE